LKARESRARGLFILDEIQKVSGWPGHRFEAGMGSGTRVRDRPLKWLLLGRRLCDPERLTESLAGRLKSSCAALVVRGDVGGVWLGRGAIRFFGAYPGAAPLMGSRSAGATTSFIRYRDDPFAGYSLVDARGQTGLAAADVQLGCDYSGQISRIRKCWGNCRMPKHGDPGHYLELLHGAGWWPGCRNSRTAGAATRVSPKLQVLNTG